MRTRYLYLLRLGLAASDLIIINLCFHGVFRFVNSYAAASDNNPLYIYCLTIYNLCWLFSSSSFELYKAPNIKIIEIIYRNTWRSLALFGILLAVGILYTSEPQYSKQFLFFLVSLLCVCFLISRLAITIIDIFYRRSYRTRRSVAVLGFNPTGIKLAHYFQRRSSGFRFEGILDEDTAMFIDDHGTLQNRMKEGFQLAVKKQVKEIYAAVPPEMLGETRSLLNDAEQLCIRLRLVPDLSGAMASRFNVDYMGEFPILSLREEPLENMHNRFKKRVFDIVFSLMVILFILSWLYPLLGLLIKLQSKGPVIFKQKRSGRDNKAFWCYKFRSMRANAESNSRQASKGDSRVTPIGSFIRRTSLDELPQFFNVLKGEMSVVGPRPHMLSHTEQYRAIIDTFMVRHFTKPGITGWAQVTGYRGETKETGLMEGRVERDIWYLENWSLMLDVRIIVMTVFTTIKGDEKAF